MEFKHIGYVRANSRTSFEIKVGAVGTRRMIVLAGLHQGL